jgi:arylsulfatase A-like enzyme
MYKKNLRIGSLFLSLLILFSGTSFNKLQEEPNSPPNVIFILADDIGQGDLGVYHRERTGEKEIISTPNMDFIAENGIRFRDANTPAALCAPTRYSVMTGCNSYRCRMPWGVWPAFDEKGAVAPGQKTAGNVMQDAGYHTAFFGKWNLGGKFEKLKEGESYEGSEYWDDDWDYSKIYDHYPNVLGFDYSLELPIGIQNVPFCFYENGEWKPFDENSKITIRKHPWGPAPRYTNVRGEYMKGDSHWETSATGPMLAKGAVDFIQKHQQEQPGNPFFIYYCSQAVHVPHEPPVEFNGKAVKGTTLSDHGDMIVEFDMQVGMIIETLKKEGILENTLIILTSDNGGLNMGATEATGHDSSNGFRAAKSSHYEGGVKVPIIAMWSGKIPSGKVSDEPVMAHDLLAMLYALTGQNMPDDQAMDSYNILPLLLDEPGAKGRETEFYQGGSGLKNYVFRQGDWKLIIEGDQQGNVYEPIALFNLEDNPFEEETGNMINDPEQQERIQTMETRYKDYRNTLERTTDPVSIE